MEELKSIIRDIPDFPKKGIIFKDITTLLSDGRSFHRMIDLIAHRYVGQKIDQIVGVEARGFVLGSALAYKLGVGVTQGDAGVEVRVQVTNTISNMAPTPWKFTKMLSARATG